MSNYNYDQGNQNYNYQNQGQPVNGPMPMQYGQPMPPQAPQMDRMYQMPQTPQVPQVYQMSETPQMPQAPQMPQNGYGYEPPYGQVPNPKKKRGILVLILSLLGAFFAAGIGLTVYLLFFSMPSIDLNRYVNVEFRGYDTVGRAGITFDVERFYLENHDHFPGMDLSSMKEFLNTYLWASIDEDDYLSNGDIVTLSWRCQDEWVREFYHVKLKYKNQKYTVSGLTESEAIDPFDYVEIIVSGSNNDGDVTYAYLDRDYRWIHLEFSQSEGLKNGDVITVYAYYDYEDPKDAGEDSREMILEYRVHFTVREKTIVVEGLGTQSGSTSSESSSSSGSSSGSSSSGSSQSGQTGSSSSTGSTGSSTGSSSSSGSTGSSAESSSAGSSSGSSAEVSYQETPLTSRRVIEVTNYNSSTDSVSNEREDVAVGRWKDIFGKNHDNALKFWVYSGSGWSNSETIKYDVTGCEKLSGEIVCREYVTDRCQRNCSMYVKMYLDGVLVYESPEITDTTSAVNYEISVAGGSVLTIECITNESVFGECLVTGTLMSR